MLPPHYARHVGVELHLSVPLTESLTERPRKVELTEDEASAFKRSLLIAAGYDKESAVHEELYLRPLNVEIPEDWGTPDDLIEIDSDLTVGQFARLTGSDAYELVFSDWEFQILWDEAFLSAMELISFGLTVHGAVSLAKDSKMQLGQLRYRELRQLAEDWRDSEDPGVIPMNLSQSVLSKNAWYRHRFDYVFGLDAISGTKLLRSLRYRKVRGAYDYVWIEEGFPDSIANDRDYLAS